MLAVVRGRVEVGHEARREPMMSGGLLEFLPQLFRRQHGVVRAVRMSNSVGQLCPPIVIDHRRPVLDRIFVESCCIGKVSQLPVIPLDQGVGRYVSTFPVKAELQRRMHEPIPEPGKWLRAVVGGHFRYYGVPMNQPALTIFLFRVGWLWHRSLSRRSQNGRVLWDRMRRLLTRWLPMASVCHPYPLRRMGVVT